MDCNESKLLEKYAGLIPKQPVAMRDVVEQLTKKFHATQIEYDEIPSLRMHQYNAVHVVKNEKLQLRQDQLQIKAIKIPINAQTESYVIRDFVPRSDENGEGNYIFLAYEEQVCYCYSNSNKLFLEAKLMSGIAQEERENRTEDWMDFIFYLKTYDSYFTAESSD